MSYAELYVPRERTYAAIYNLILTLSASLLIALSAQLSIRLPFSPVPITGQTFTVLLLAALLGKRRGMAAILLYLTEGALGLPVFASGKGGVAALLGPTGGYLVGFAAAMFLVGELVERGWDRKSWSSLLAMGMGNLVVYTFGLAWLSFYVGGRQVLSVGLYPFLPGDALKIGLAAAVLAISGTFKPGAESQP